MGRKTKKSAKVAKEKSLLSGKLAMDNYGFCEVV